MWVSMRCLGVISVVGSALSCAAPKGPQDPDNPSAVRQAKAKNVVELHREWQDIGLNPNARQQVVETLCKEGRGSEYTGFLKDVIAVRRLLAASGQEESFLQEVEASNRAEANAAEEKIAETQMSVLDDVLGTHVSPEQKKAWRLYVQNLRYSDAPFVTGRFGDWADDLYPATIAPSGAALPQATALPKTSYGAALSQPVTDSPQTPLQERLFARLAGHRDKWWAEGMIIRGSQGAPRKDHFAHERELFQTQKKQLCASGYPALFLDLIADAIPGKQETQLERGAEVLSQLHEMVQREKPGERAQDQEAFQRALRAAFHHMVQAETVGIKQKNILKTAEPDALFSALMKYGGPDDSVSPLYAALRSVYLSERAAANWGPWTDAHDKRWQKLFRDDLLQTMPLPESVREQLRPQWSAPAFVPGQWLFQELRALHEVSEKLDTLISEAEKETLIADLRSR